MIHIQTWKGGPSARITDMTNAGKRGKVCRTFHWQGYRWNGARDAENKRYHDNASASLQTEVMIDRELTAEMDYNSAVLAIRASMAKWPAEERFVSVREDTIKGIDAPREKLTAGVDGVWSGGAGENGIHLADLTDQNNDPRIITPSSQSSARAYDLARKVWFRVMQAKTMHEASEILGGAGCKLRYYCAMD